MKTHLNECGLLTYLGGSPKPRQDVDQQPCNSCSSTVQLVLTPFPRKNQHLLLNLVRGRLPQSFHSLQSPSMTRFTLIKPSCSGFLFGNDCASKCSRSFKARKPYFLEKLIQRRSKILSKLRTPSIHQVQRNGRLSLGSIHWERKTLGERLDEGIDLAERVVKVRRDAEAIASRGCDYPLPPELRVQSHWGETSLMTHADYL